MKQEKWRVAIIFDAFCSAANKYYSSAGQHEQKNRKTAGQIKFSAVTVKQ